MDELLTAREVSDWLKTSTDNLQRWRVEGGGPPYIKLGNAKSAGVRYRKSAIMDYLAAAERCSSSE
jgi:hypothetical protein